MAKERTIASYFTTSTGASKAADNTPSPPSSPLSPCPSNISSQTFSSPTKPPPRQSPLKNTLTSRLSLSNDGPTICNPKPPPSSQHTSSGTSFGSSQRVVKDGQVVVTGTDGEDTESIYSFGSDDDLCRKLLGSGSPLRPSEKKGTSQIPTTPPGYKFSLEDLVTHAVDDRETEANISRLRLSFKGPGENSGPSKVNRTPKQRSRMFRDSILASAVGEDTNTETMQRLKAAVDRTEAVDQGKTWSFFEDTISSVPPPKFPEKSVAPGSWESVLTGEYLPETRERAFFSGLVGESLSGNTLPDEIFIWIFHACTTEPRNEVRFAYCSAIKVAPAKRVSSLIHSTHIEQLFRNLGARQDALSIQDVVMPDFHALSRPKPKDYKYLLSALDVIDGIASKLNNDARDYALKVALRLTLDETSMRDCFVSAATQRAITSLLGEGVLLTDLALYELSVVLYNTIKDPALQSQLLKHISPATPKVALLRCRLAAAFFFEDKTFLDKPAELVFDLKRMTIRLQDDRFKIHRSTPTGQEPLDYWELSAITSILDVAIGSGTAEKSFPNKESEAKFNRDVDKLAEQIKVIFTAIKDTGASHLKRTEAKEYLQALHYRLIYGVRTKPRPKVSWFVPSKSGGVADESWSGIKKSGNLMDRFLSRGKDNDSNDGDLSDQATDMRL
ncbi:hypothetical protein CPC735_024470 [Coccidioides posadasii C735 delta SOWgp]|uniref:Uncharacterized protein n=1 Tax=Coccidioides posadasii (strain C735) TaxID=222929 RepID=C5P6R1_COCP7|nr:hypothetical protein CPC735_024470 [Coccidioides posadasii C735 delta SOWgp]EER27111.1 hypothetical protein CPC735_024470 [Coccidioides posadasii C735 delta SOWgp]|eukprot:XP_003069256.1 hypothetical protein CPC735_024470 [Coccidioides posadasii C735 delta SOWgp]